MKDNAICVICGERPATTGQGDHVPPRSLYTKPERTAKWRFHTVPACSSCNNGGSLDDEVLKMLIGIGTGESRNGGEVIDSMAKTIEKNRRLANHIFSHHRKVNVLTKGVIRPMVAIEFDGAAYARVIERIARAMYWRMTQKIAGKLASVRVFPPDRMTQSLRQDLALEFSSVPPFEVNGGTFETKLVQLGGMDILAMRFFKQHQAMAVFDWIPESAPTQAAT